MRPISGKDVSTAQAYSALRGALSERVSRPGFGPDTWVRNGDQVTLTQDTFAQGGFLYGASGGGPTVVFGAGSTISLNPYGQARGCKEEIILVQDGGTTIRARHTYKPGIWSNCVTEMLDYSVRSPYGMVAPSDYRRKETSYGEGAKGWMQTISG